MCTRIDGLPIVNATKELSFDINQRLDIARATRLNPNKCAIAWALKRHGFEDAKVYRSRTFTKTKSQNYWVRHQTPADASFALRVFDDGGKFDPGPYTLEVVRPRRDHPTLATSAHHKAGIGNAVGKKRKTRQPRPQRNVRERA